MPAYNEAACIAEAVAEVRRCVLDQVSDSELVVVNDGSKDNTGAILDRLASLDPRISVVHQPNGGHGRALRAGMDAAGGKYFFLIDSDRQIPLEAFTPLWQDGQAADGAFGMRVRRNDPGFRLFLTRMIRHTVGLLFGIRIYDANVPFKIIRREIWEAARPLIPEDTLAPSLFVAIYAAWAGCKIRLQEVSHRERETGTVSIRRWKLIKFCARALRQLVALRWRLIAHPVGHVQIKTVPIQE
jgi:glycosyltransferase involved in cell wall biosynthesis